MEENTIWTKGYSHDPHRVNRVSSDPIDLEHPALNALLMIQPGKALELYGNERLSEDGFLARILVSDTKAQLHEVPEDADAVPLINADLKQRYQQEIFQLFDAFRLSKRTECLVVYPDIGVDRIFRQHKNHTIRQRRGEWQDIDAYAARFTENTWRIAVLLHAATHRKDAATKNLSAKTAEDALRISEWFSQELLSLLGPAREEVKDDRLSKLYEKVNKAHGKITMRELKRSNWIEKEVRELVQRSTGKLLIDEVRGKGEPSFVVRRATHL
jgi:Protein of unknown function (DUF3987)